MNIRAATVADWPSVSALLSEAKLPLVGVREHFHEFLVATEGEVVVGCVGLEHYGTSALLRSLVVAPAHRASGIGAALADACVERARASGVTSLVLLTETAEKFFARRHFVRSDRGSVPVTVHASREFQGACPASAVVMVRELQTDAR